jgi:hypothetical protein
MEAKEGTTQQGPDIYYAFPKSYYFPTFPVEESEAQRSEFHT